MIQPQVIVLPPELQESSLPVSHETRSPIKTQTCHAQNLSEDQLVQICQKGKRRGGKPKLEFNAQNAFEDLVHIFEKWEMCDICDIFTVVQ